ncbi:MAG: hypothetical protein Q7U38_09515 [Methylobacter sp.]|nr:hypothetical protein [Methylobacter sp.]MDP2098989.1 hypothetical protein [Methylobacter sp.]MDP2427534.1 hypothetical protein [Methylobacter sp.]MDP3056819.1 hypothetical protein [Methylobacter sp.]MDP3361260.1 hypothetical protein [Methylobacter sp.]
MIKNFIYLDEEKMYSLSSQVFEGVTEYVLNEKSSESENAESQKGPVGSGRILGDILRQADKKTEKKFLSDFSYTLFEKKLLDDNKVIEVGEDFLIEELRDKAESISFIKVTAKAVFNDMKLIKETLKNFNNFGLALTHVTNVNVINEARERLEKAKSITKDRNQQSKLTSQDKSIIKIIEKLANEHGLQQDQKFLDNLVSLFDYGFQDQLEIQMQLTDSIVSANLKRNFLRESEELMIKKYSRQTECNFVMFGIITQYKRDKLNEIKELSGIPSIKEALMNMMAHLTNIEEGFIGRLSNEVIIDPIALYTEL